MSLLRSHLSLPKCVDVVAVVSLEQEGFLFYFGLLLDFGLDLGLALDSLCTRRSRAGGFARWTVAFQLPVGAGGAHRALAFHPAVRARDALRAVPFPLAVGAGVALRA